MGERSGSGGSLRRDGLRCPAGKIGGPARVGVGIEGTGLGGAGLTRRPELGYCVYEVMAPGVRRKPGRPKSDPADAEAAARQVLARVDLSKPKDQSGWTEELRAAQRWPATASCRSHRP